MLWDVERDCTSGAEPELVWWPCTVQALSDGAVDLVLDDGADETLVALHTVRHTPRCSYPAKLRSNTLILYIDLV